MMACFGGKLPFLLADDLNAKHINCKQRLNTRLGKSYVIMPVRTPV
jgi:hypothetical protein